MGWRTKHDSRREYTNVDVEDTVSLIDIGGGVPGLPPVDGSQLTGIIAVAEPCVSRDITSKTIQDRETCFFDEPVITGTITILGDGRLWVT